MAVLAGGGRNLSRFAASQYHYLDGLNFLLTGFYDSIIRDTPVPIPYTEILRISEMMDSIVQQVGETSLSFK